MNAKQASKVEAYKAAEKKLKEAQAEMATAHKQVVKAFGIDETVAGTKSFDEVSFTNPATYVVEDVNEAETTLKDILGKTLTAVAIQTKKTFSKSGYDSVKTQVHPDTLAKLEVFWNENVTTKVGKTQVKVKS